MNDSMFIDFQKSNCWKLNYDNNIFLSSDLIQGLDENIEIDETVGKSIQRIVSKIIDTVEYKWSTVVLYYVSSYIVIALILCYQKLLLQTVHQFVRSDNALLLVWP